MMAEFWAALVESCRNDSVLAELTGDSDDHRHIGRNKPVGDAEYPFLGVYSASNLPAIADAYTGFKRTLVSFNVMTKGKENEITIIKIADRLENLLHRDGEDQNKQYWDISSDDISSKWTNFIRGDVNEFEEKTAVWRTQVIAEFFWHLKTPVPIE